MVPIDQIVSADRLLQRFGRWPSFHDAEVITLRFDRRGPAGPFAEMLVHTWAGTGEVDSTGYYVRERHTLVRFIFERIAASDFVDFNHQNVLFDLKIERETVEGEVLFRITLEASFGLGASFLCGRVVISEATSCDDHGNPVV